MSMTQRYAGMLRRNAGEWDKLEMPVQAECLRQAARHMEEREQTLADEIATLGAQLAAAEARAERLGGLSPIHAAETARRARAFLHAFVGQEFGEFAECGSHDRQHLGIALDYVEELSSMVLTLAEVEAG